MSSKRIADLPVKNPTDAMKIPTGGFGDYAVTLKSISEWLVGKYSLATKEELELVDETLKSLIELKADKTSVYTKQEVDTIVQQAKERLEQSIQLTDSRVGSLETTVDSNYQTLSQNKADKNNVVNSVGGRKGDVTYQQIKSGLNLGDLADKNEEDVLVDSKLKTWSGRNQEQKNKDSMHVLDFKTGSKTDQEAIQDAVNYCLANNRTLDWEGAHLTSTDNVLNMWDVTHIGNGSITRNGNVFYFNNIGKESTIHVAKYIVGILPVNDGLSPAFPIYPAMINSFFDNFNVLHGNYVFQFKAEVYANSSLNRVYIGGLDKTESNINQLSGAIIFRGADVGFNFDSLENATAIPTTVFGSESTSTNSILFNLRNANYRFESIKGINQNGIVAISNGGLVVRNAHGLGNTRDIQGLESSLDVLGGILDGGLDRTGNGINSFFLTKHNIGSQSNTAQKTPIIRRKSTGFLVQEGSTGHSDFVTYEDCTTGSLANVNARINTNGSTYTNCAVGVRASNGGNVYVPDNVVFNNCTENVRIQNSEIVSNVGTPQFSYADKEVRILTSVTPLTTSTNTRELVSRIEMPPFVLKSGSIGPTWQGKKVKIVCRGVITGVSGTKRFDIYAAANPTDTTGNYITNATALADSNGSFEFVADLIISSNIVCASKLTTSIGTRQVFLNNNIVDSNLFATKPFILLTCLCESASDRVQVNSVECYMSS